MNLQEISLTTWFSCIHNIHYVALYFVTIFVVDLISESLRSLYISSQHWCICIFLHPPRNLKGAWWMNGISFPASLSLGSYGKYGLVVFPWALTNGSLFMVRLLHLARIYIAIIVLVQPRNVSASCSNSSHPGLVLAMRVRSSAYAFCRSLILKFFSW